MTVHQHAWAETGQRRRHVEGGFIEGKPMFKYGTPIVTYLRCAGCGRVGFRRPGSRVVYTWNPEDGR